MTIRRMRIACWITKATDTHLKYVILIGFSRLQWFHESVLLLVRLNVVQTNSGFSGLTSHILSIGCVYKRKIQYTGLSVIIEIFIITLDEITSHSHFTIRVHPFCNANSEIPFQCRRPEVSALLLLHSSWQLVERLATK